MESTINFACKSHKVTVIAEAALKVKLALETICIAALAPPTLMFGSVSPFDLKKTPHARGKINLAKDTPALGPLFAPLIKSSNLKCVFKTPKIPMTNVAVMVTSEGQSCPQTRSRSKRTSEGSSSAQMRGLVVLTSKPQRKKNNRTRKGRATKSVNSIDSSSSSNSAEESSFSSNPLYDQPEAIFMEEEFLPHVHNNVSTPSSPSVSQKSFAKVLVTGAEGDKTMGEIIAKLQQKIIMADFVADQDEMKRDENQTISQSKAASCHMVHSTEEEHDEIEEKDTPKEEAVEHTSNEACPIQLRAGKQLPKRTTQVEKKSKGKAVEENESTGEQSQQGAKKVVNEKSPTKYDVLAHLKKI
ncbi:hypothetical protein MRB53_026476 [Persea americana]|uniref:Uncharacterized protein n=1 Tax=Persea americana TaxID=3435 RepID=A0ACC2LIQ5_PERAE|nr:hypothetical protein MRB53_026476 [Persea americana]